MMYLQRKGFHLGTAEFTRDMVETLLEYFDTYADEDGVISLEIHEGGIFLPPLAEGVQQFLGLARLPVHLAKQAH